ncbi:MAG: PAS domain S-box protein [Acidobacteriota bacterium]|nr:PAS domain S-box protein [Acidobacteriota bacterium]
MHQYPSSRWLSFRLHIFPAVVFIVFSIVFFALWRQTMLRDNAEIKAHTQTMANQAAIRLETYFETRFQVLEQLHWEWLTGGPYDLALFEKRTETIHRNFAGFLAINWVDPEGVIRWVTPPGPNRKALGLDLMNHPDIKVRRAISGTVRDRKTSYTPPIVLAQGGLGVVSYIPLVRDGKLEGALSGVFRIAPLVEECLDSDIIAEFDFRIGHDNLEVYRNGGPPSMEASRYLAESTFFVGGERWVIVLNPKPENLGGSLTQPRFLLLVLGQFLSLFLALGIHFVFRRQIDLMRSETRYATLFANANDAIILIENFAIVDCNPVTFEMFRCNAGDLPRLAFHLFANDLGHGNSSSVIVRERSQDALSGRMHFFEGSFQRLDGSTFFAEIYLNGLVVDERRMIQMIIRDISARKRTEHKLLESEEKYRLLVENAADAIFIIGDRTIEFANPKALKLTGYEEEDLYEIDFFELIDTEYREALENLLSLLGTAAEPVPLQMINQAGERLWLLVSAVPIHWRERECALIFARDITLQKTLETRLLHSQKMESVGTLAGGIAHDFNNLLMGMQGYVSLMLIDKDTPAEIKEKLTAIERQIQSGANLTRQLLGFARGGKYDVQPTNMVDLVEKSAELFGRTHKELTIHKDFSPEVHTVEVDRTQMEQVLLNLYLNSWQAMGSRGQIFLVVRNITLEASFCRAYGVEEGDYVLVRVRDTGEGMDEATRQRVFEPFFSKRQRGRGTGLGLASAYGIVKNHGGAITVESQIGKGATFDIYLPASKKRIVEETRPLPAPTTGTGTVLIVDDEEMILEVGSAMLNKLGYQVLTAADADTALALFREHQASVDLVILDMIMPGQSGGELYERLVTINPGVKVLLSSGYSLNEEAKGILARGVNGFIQKPYTLAGLSTKVREVLGGPHD